LTLTLKQRPSPSLAQSNSKEITMYTGAKYDSTLDTAEIAKRFRADVKEALTNEARFLLHGRTSDAEKPRLPLGVKLSVRIERYSGGSSINVSIIDLPEGMSCPYSEAYLGYCAAGTHSSFGGERYIPEFKTLKLLLVQLLNAYNRDRSDSQVDYFDRRFYEHVELSSELGKTARYMVLAPTQEAA